DTAPNCWTELTPDVADSIQYLVVCPLSPSCDSPRIPHGRLGAGALTILASSAFGQGFRSNTHAPTREYIEQQLLRLNADDLETREEATRTLQRDVDWSSADVEILLEEDALTPEQRTRLESIGRVVFSTESRPALGIRFSTGTRAGIASTTPGFDADEQLEADDVVLMADGIFIRGQNDFRLAILAKRPGDTLSLEIERAGETRHVEVELGEYSTLGQGQPTRATIEGAWNTRLALRTTDVLSLDLDEADWVRADLENYRDANDPDRMRTHHILPSPWVSPGGAARAPSELVDLPPGGPRDRLIFVSLMREQYAAAIEAFEARRRLEEIPVAERDDLDRAIRETREAIRVLDSDP
ncbi:MAG: PDZ domain-containing protein, partial [Phycisphaerales bacterium]|nr:PDZ domain-containing protein [Phycisphaerales bacterium]